MGLENNYNSNSKQIKQGCTIKKHKNFGRHYKLKQRRAKEDL